MGEFDRLSLDLVGIGNDALDAMEEATATAGEGDS